MILTERTGQLLGLLILTAQSIAACANSSASLGIESFKSRYQIDDVNQTITLEPMDADLANDTNTRSVELVIRNNSEDTIVFPPGFGVEGLVYEAGLDQWIEVPNTVRYPEVSRGLGAIDSNLPAIGIVDFLPPKEIDIEGRLRIVVVGNVFLDEADRGRVVMAYLDVEYGGE